MSSDSEKEEFLKKFGQDYGYPNAPNNIDEIRATQFKRLNDTVYLDHAGATLYSESQIEDVFNDFKSNLYGNPHSQSNCSLSTTDVVGEARRQVLKFFNASPGEYRCIFTSGATASLKLIGETFPWSSQSTFMYTVENHNSVLGIREYALHEGAAAVAVDVEEISDLDQSSGEKSSIKIKPHCLQRRSEAEFKKNEQSSDTYNLFAFPSECNFSGTKFDLSLVNFIKEESHTIPGMSQPHSGQWMVLIDAAKGSTTSPPDLSRYKADFVVVSFYKLFGYPTGIGALIVRNEPARMLKKTYFSGGTVAASIADIDFYKRRDGIEDYLEDGTVSFMSIASLHHGFKILNTLTMTAISRHAMSLANYVRGELLNLRHANGNSVSVLYGPDDTKRMSNGMGPVVSFNMKRPDGLWFGYREVEKLASLSNIQLRTGCFCNPGACAKHLGLSHSDILSNIEEGHVCWDDQDIVHGKPTGAIRVSFGYMSSFEDARKFLKFIVTAFVSLLPHPTTLDLITEKPFDLVTQGLGRPDPLPARYFLKCINIYPIKSCAGFSMGSWPLSSTGLLHDREWLLKSLSGEILTQKKVPEMSSITTLIDLKLGILVVKSTRCKERLEIELLSNQTTTEREIMEIYRQRHEVQFYRNEIDIWFSNAVGRPCTLVRSSASQNNTCEVNRLCRDMETRMNFVNEAQFLLISEESVNDLNNRLRLKLQNGSHEVTPSRFRPNLVFSGGEPYAEDGWRSLKIGNTNFTSMGGCNRCQMINLTSISGNVQKSNEPLSTLASYRRLKGKIYFGILLKLYDTMIEPGDVWVSVGQEIFPDKN